MGLEGFANFSKKTFVVQDTIDPNISWPSEIFMTPPINFSLLFKGLLIAVFQGSTHSNIQISNH